MNSNSGLTIVNLVFSSVNLIAEYFYMHKEMNFKKNSTVLFVEKHAGMTAHAPSSSLP